MKSVALGAVIVLLAGELCAGEDWPRFRGPNGSGVSGLTGLPAEFGPAKNLVWKTAVPFARSSPAIAGNRIFLTASEGEKLITLCLDRSNGRILWRREIVRPRITPVYKLNDPASPSPATDGRNVYAFFPDLGLISFGPDGEERWRLSLGPFHTFYGLGASPIVSGNTVLLNCDSRLTPFLIAVDASSGNVRWRVERKDARFEGYASPVIWEPKGEPAQAIVLGSHRIDAYSVATGERLWWVSGLGTFPVGSPVIGGGVVVVSTYGSDSVEGPTFDEWLKKDANGDGRISPEEVGKEFEVFGALDLDSNGFLDRTEWDAVRNSALGDYGLVAVRLGGRGDLTRTGVVWRDKRVYNNIASLLIYKDVLYTAKSGGILVTLDASTGKPFKIERQKESAGDYYSSPVAADGKVFWASESGKVLVLKAGSQWEVLAINDLGDECYATPAIAEGHLYIRTRGALHAFGKK